MDSMAWDMRHPYIPSTTVLGDTGWIGQGVVWSLVDKRF